MFSRVGVYMRLPGVDAARFAETVQQGGILGYIDALSGGSISRVGIFSLGARALCPCTSCVGRGSLGACKTLHAPRVGIFAGCARALPVHPAPARRRWGRSVLGC